MRQLIKTQGKSLLEYLDQLPPYLCRMLARRMGKGKKRVPMTTAEIVEASGLDKKTVLDISGRETWAEVFVSTADAFRKGCGITPSNQGRQLMYLARTRQTANPFAHLDKLHYKQRRMIQRKLNALHVNKAPSRD